MAATITLKEAPRRRAMLERHMPYDVLLRGARVAELYFNTRGYNANPGLPLPGGGFLSIPEGSLTSIKREISALNREFAAAGKDT